LLIAILRGANRPESKALFDDILRNALFLVIASTFLTFGYPFISVIWAHLLSALLTFLSLLTYSLVKPFYQKVPYTKTDLKNARKEIIKYSLPLLAIAVISPLFASLDSLILSFFNTPKIVGYYSAVYPIANLIPVLMSAVAFTTFPFFCQLYAKYDLAAINQTYKQITKLLIIISFPLFLAFFVFPKPVITLFFGSQFVPACPALRIIVLATFLLITMGPTDTVLQAAGKTKFLMYAGIAGFIVNICLNLIFIPWLGMIGAAIAYLLGRNTIYLIQSIKINHLMRMHFYDIQHIKLLIILSCLLIMSNLITQNANQSYVFVFTFLILFFPIYLVVFIGFTIIGKTEWDFLKKILKIKFNTA
jgi:O-antigen/teichoic acid export membrane protein